VFHSGGIELDPERATAAIATHIGEPLGLDVHGAALGIVAVANASMANAVRAVTVERGLDPRDFALVAYGGAGPLHAVDVARELAVNDVVIPFAPGHFSAFGMLMADHRRDFVQTHFATVADDELARVEDVYRELEQQGVAHLERAGIARERIAVERTADMRYLGQEHTVSVEVPTTLLGSAGTSDWLTASFHARHLEEYRHQAEDQAVEIVSVRVSAIGQVDKPRWPELGENGPTPGRERRRQVWFPDSGPLDTPVVVRSDLRAGERRSGPLIVEEAGSVTCVPPAADLTVDGHGNLVIRC
jgi:N-methylhydantoinase A